HKGQTKCFPRDPERQPLPVAIRRRHGRDSATLFQVDDHIANTIFDVARLGSTDFYGLESARTAHRRKRTRRELPEMTRGIQTPTVAAEDAGFQRVDIRQGKSEYAAGL